LLNVNCQHVDVYSQLTDDSRTDQYVVLKLYRAEEEQVWPFWRTLFSWIPLDCNITRNT